MQTVRKTEIGVRAVALAAATVGVILMVFLTQLMVGLQADVAHLRDVLVTKDELANLAMYLGPRDPAVAALEGTCTDCHTAATFQAAHGLNEEVDDLVGRMARLAGAHVAPEEVPRAEAALTFMKCAHCHTIDRLKALAILSPEDRWQVIISMAENQDGTISEEDAARIRDFYGDFWGWHRQ